MLIRYNDAIIDAGDLELTPNVPGGHIYFTTPVIPELVDTDIKRVMVNPEDDIFWHRAIVRDDGSLLVDMTNIREWWNND